VKLNTIAGLPITAARLSIGNIERLKSSLLSLLIILKTPLSLWLLKPILSGVYFTYGFVPMVCQKGHASAKNGKPLASRIASCFASLDTMQAFNLQDYKKLFVYEQF